MTQPDPTQIALTPPNVRLSELLLEQICSSCLRPFQLPNDLELCRVTAWYAHYGFDACKCAVFLCAACEPRFQAFQPIVH